MLLQTITPPVAVGYGRAPTTELAVKKCIEALGDINPTMMLIFCGGKHDGVATLNAFRAKYGDIPIVGGAGAGAISGDGFGYSGFEITALAINHASLTPRIFVSDRLLEDEFDASRQLGHDVSEHINIGDTVTLFYDSIASIDPLKLHAATPILNGFMEGCGHKRPQIVGGGLLTDLNLSEGWVYDGQSKVHHGVVALAWPSQLHAETFVMHGCIPASAFLEITRIDGAEVYELDGEPALQVLEKRLGLLTTGPSGTLSLLATLGQKQGDPYAEFDENAYVNRLILTANPETGSVTLFEPDFSVGSKVQVMARDNKMMLDSVRRGVAAANEIIRHGDAVFAMYIDCAGRASARSGAVTEEAEVLVEGLDSSIPLVGLYSGVEIAPFEGSPRGLDWTGLLCVMRYDQCR